MPVKHLKVGADPEFFLFDTDKGLYISAHDRVPGTKDKPVPLKNGGMIQADGLAVEFNIPASSSSKEFVDNLRAALSDIRKEYFLNDKNIQFAFDPVANFSEAYMKQLPDYAKELGCEPDYDAYTGGKPNPKPDNKKPMRTGSGHIHVGFLSKLNQVENPKEDEQHIQDCCVLAMAMDVVFLPHKNRWDQDTKRSSMYGNPGCFRPKAYGMEYRTLSNAWLRYPKLWPWLFGGVKRAIEIAEDPELFKTYCGPINQWETLANTSQYMKHIASAGSQALARARFSNQVTNAVLEGHSPAPLKSRIVNQLVV